jgi:LDH2 family malate/lactate/ureidoglycolate dehydrogenase
MLERFHVPSDIEVRVEPDAMRATVQDLFEALGLSEEDARQSTDVLLYADLRGIESHGVSNMLRVYVQGLQAGRINPKPQWTIEREAAAVCTIDSDGAHGGVIGPVAMRIAMDRAEAYGVGAVSVANGGHFGAAAYHAAMALERDMIGVAMTAGGVAMAPTYGASALLGLNPLAIAAPAREEPPFIFDASMSSVAGNKIRLARRLGQPALPGWIAEADGSPIMDEREIPEDFVMLPLGGTREIGSHKGYGLAVMIEILSSVLAGRGAGPNRRAGQAHHFIAYKIDAFTDLDAFKDDMDEYLRALRDCPPAPGQDAVTYAGLPEHEEEIERSERGIPYHPEVIDWFREVTTELGVPFRFG